MGRGRSLFSFLMLLFIFSQPLFAQKSSVTPLDLQKADAASKIKDPVAATKAYLDSVPLERREKTKAYAHGNYFLDIVDFLFVSAILLWLISSGLSVRFRNFAQRVVKKPSLQTAIYWFQFFAVITLIQLPLTIYSSYYREKKYDDAVKELQEAAKLDPRNATIVNNLGFTLYRFDKYEESLVWLLKAIEIDPRRSVAYANLADAYMKLGKTAEARQYYEKYAEMAPNSPTIDYVRKKLEELKGK